MKSLGLLYIVKQGEMQPLCGYKHVTAINNLFRHIYTQTRGGLAYETTGVFPGGPVGSWADGLLVLPMEVL